MLWLGSRKFARLQVTGGTSGEDLMVAGPSVMPEALADWFRPRPSGALLNLMRKELRLLRPVWVIELMVVVYLTGLAIFRLLPSPPVFLPETVLQWAVLGPTAMTCMGLVGLAGILSLGEERRSGTQAWHMTLPISARTQWLITLLVAMFAGLAYPLSDPDLFLLLVRLRSKWHRKRSDVDHAFYCRDPICLRGRDMAWTRSGAVNGHAEGFRHFLLSSQSSGTRGRHRLRPLKGALAVCSNVAIRAAAKLSPISNSAAKQQALDVAVSSTGDRNYASMEFFCYGRVSLFALGALRGNPPSA